MARRTSRIVALALLLAACRDDPGPAASGSTGPGSDATSTGDTSSTTALADDTTDGEVPEPICGDEVPSFVDPLRPIGHHDAGLDGLVSLVATPTHVYGCTLDAGLVVWSLADPQSPAMLGSGLDASGGSPRCDAIASSDDGTQLVTTRHAEGGEGGVTVWSLADPDAPAVLAHLGTALPVQAAVIAAGRVFVAAGTEGLRTLALDVDQLVEQGSFVDADSDARALAWVDDRLLVAEAREGLRAFDVAADDPVLLDRVGLGAVAFDVRIDGDLAYVATLESVAVVDLADLAALDLLAQVPTQGVALDLAQRGSMLVVADWDELRGISIADPTVPTLRFGEWAPGSDPLDRARAVAMAGDLVVASGWSGLHVYELEAEPLAPELEVEVTRVDFREVAAGDSDDVVVVLRNTGDAPLSLCGMVSTLPGIEIDAPADVIEPASTLAVELSFTAATDDPVQGQLHIVSNDPDESTWIVPITANTPRVDVGDPAIAFRHVDVDGRIWSSHDFDGQVRLLSYFASW